MKKWGLFFLLFCLFIPLQATGADVDTDKTAARRYALIVGSNFGGNKTQNLKYAAKDAREVSRILSDIGGITEENKLLLMNPDKDMIRSSFNHLRQLIANAPGDKSRVETIFYYSGHSDDEGLLLYGDKYYYTDLKKDVSAIPSAVQIVILDSCSSGAFTRLKGGRIKPPFLLDTSNISRGHAYLTSSTAAEDSQESDAIESSFFTYALISGLRGAADTNNDGNVTLNEAYQYSFDETISRTEKTSAGVQHPAYKINLSGTGNIILTNIRENTSRLIMEKNIVGKVYIRDTTGRLVAELRKERGKEVEISLSPGIYDLNLDDGKDFYFQEFTIRNNGTFTLSSETAMKKEVRKKMKSKGNEDWPRQSLHLFGYQAYGTGDMTHFSMDLFTGSSLHLSGVMLSLLSNNAKYGGSGFQWALGLNNTGAGFEGIQASAGFNDTDGDFNGYQQSIFYNNASGSFKGLQLTGLMNNIGENLTGAQVSALNLTDGHAAFLQAGLYNYAGRGITGLQLGAMNYTIYDVQGVQIGPFGNWTAGHTYGIQFGGLFNYSYQLSGVQISGANIADSFRGLQLGVVNYARQGKGVQIGILNISEDLAGVPIGIIDIQKNGENHLEIFSEAGNFNFTGDDYFHTLGYRLGSRYFYKLIKAGFRTGMTEASQAMPMYSAGIGLGARLPLGSNSFALLLDAGANIVNYTQAIDTSSQETFADHFIPSFRLFFEWKWGKQFGLIAGINNRLFFENFNDGKIPSSGFMIIDNDSNKRVFMTTRPFIGLEF